MLIQERSTGFPAVGVRLLRRVVALISSGLGVTSMWPRLL